MGLTAIRENLWIELLDQLVISSARSEHIATTSIKDALEQDIACEKLVIQAAERIDVNLSFHVKPLQIGHKQVQVSEY